MTWQTLGLSKHRNAVFILGAPSVGASEPPRWVPTTPTTEVAIDIRLFSGHRGAPRNALHQFPVRQTEPTTLTKQNCRLHKGFAAMGPAARAVARSRSS